jgi:mannitol/fructose-specific phosphotransferase system IIA component (Ntr-type)
MLEKYLTTDRIRIGLYARDWRDLVDQVGEVMVEMGDVEPSYVEAMKKVTEEMGPYSVIAPGVVLLHARPEEGVHRICFVLVTLAEGISFGSDNDPVLLAIGLGALDHESHVEALRDLASLLGDRSKVEGIMNANKIDEVLKIIKT